MFSILETTGKDLSWIPQDKYVLANTTDKALEYIEKAQNYDSPVLGFDTETNGLSYFVHKIVGFSMAYAPGYAAYFPLHHYLDENLRLEDIFEPLKNLLTSKEIVAHNGNFDWSRVLNQWKINFNFKHDTMYQAWLIDSERGPKQQRSKLSLKHLSKEKLGFEMIDLKEMTGDYNFAKVDVEDALWYAGPDADNCLRLHFLQEKEMEKLKLQGVYQIEMAAVKPPGEMQLNGIRLDKQFLMEADLNSELSSLEEEIAKQTGLAVNVGSPTQLSDLLFNQLSLPKLKGESTDDSVLEKLADRHPVVPLIREHREISKLQSTFVDKLNDAVAEDGRIHPDYVATGTRSGRFSSHGGLGRRGKKIKMNAQTWPKGKRVNIREALKPSKGSIWASMDYSQIEYRALAFTSGQETLIEAFRQGVDFHKAAAALFLKLQVENVTSAQRKRGKTLNFGVVYGMSIGGLADRLNCDYQAAKEMQELYFSTLDKVKKLIDEKKRFALKNGYMRTEFGRIRWFRGLEKLDQRARDRKLDAAFNTFIQGTAADLYKIGLARVYKQVKANLSEECRFLSTVHDETNLEITRDSDPRVVLPKLTKAMTLPPGLRPNWLEFPADLELGTSYGTLVVIPKHLIEQYSKWEDLIEASEEFNEKAKQEEKEKAAQSRSQDKEYIPEGLKIQEVTRMRPSVSISLAERGDPKEQLEFLANLFQQNYGLYRVYIKAEEKGEFLTTQARVNPSKQFIEELQSRGLGIELFKAPTKKFDPSKLSFT